MPAILVLRTPAQTAAYTNHLSKLSVHRAVDVYVPITFLIVSYPVKPQAMGALHGMLTGL